MTLYCSFKAIKKKKIISFSLSLLFINFFSLSFFFPSVSSMIVSLHFFSSSFFFLLEWLRLVTMWAAQFVCVMMVRWV